jgi:hypothetical protein
MAKRATPERLEEFRSYVAFVRSIPPLLEKLCPGIVKGLSYLDRPAAEAESAAASGVVPSGEMSGWKQAAADLLEMTRDFSLDEVKAADAFLIISAGGVSLTEMRARIWRTIPKVLTRNRIRNLDEFYIIKNAVDDGDLPAAERARLDALLGEFEERAGRKGGRRRS